MKRADAPAVGVSIQAFILYPWHEGISKELRALELKDGEMKRRIRELREKDEQLERRIEDLVARVKLPGLPGASPEEQLVAVIAASRAGAEVRNKTTEKPWHRRFW